MWQQSRRVTAGALFVGVAVGATGLHVWQRQTCQALAFVHPDVACALPAHEPTYAAGLDVKLAALLDERAARGDLSRAAILFRGLLDGPEIAIHEDERFIPASLVKLPLAFVYFMLERQHPGTLQEELTYSTEQLHDSDPLHAVEVTDTGLERGKRYTVERLLQGMVEQSDNLSYYLLAEHVPETPGALECFERTFRELGVTNPARIEDQVASVREYSSLLRLLYNASYLNAKDSDKLLSWLGASTYDGGIAAGVPKNLTVANKFGERFLPDGTKQLHDCGVIYYAGTPYSLCVMTAGTDFTKLKAFVAEVSRMVFAEVSSSGGRG